MKSKRIISFFLLILVVLGGASLQAMDSDMARQGSRAEPVRGAFAAVYGDDENPELPRARKDLHIIEPERVHGDPYASQDLNPSFEALESDKKDLYLRAHARNKAADLVAKRVAEVFYARRPSAASADGDAGGQPDYARDAVSREVWNEYRKGIPQLMNTYENREINKLYARHNPGPIRKILAPLDEYIMTPYSLWYDRNAHLINSGAKLMFMASAAAVVFHHMGGTEWVKRKIREAFDRPKIYTVQQANSIGDDKRRAAGQQLVLSPEVQRNVNEIVETLRWYNGLSKARQREYKLRGVLFYGPPGTGKTSLARALAHRTGWHLIELMADDFNKIKHVADKLVVLEEMFARARTMGKTMIFLDELEKLVLDRDKGDSPLLTKMLELAERGDVFIIGATNRYYDIDSAFRRRLRYHVEVKSPTTRMRYQILDNYIGWILRDKGYAFDANAMELAQLLKGKAGAHIESLVERMRDRARLYGNTITDDAGEERLLVSDQIAREILVDMGIIEPEEEEEDVLNRDAILEAERVDEGAGDVKDAVDFAEDAMVEAEA